MSNIDPILLSVYARTFKSITDEMSISIQQTARSPILCEAKAFVTGLYDAEGNMLEQTENLPILAFSLAPVCKYILEYFEGDINDGDVIFHNDVFSMGNQNNDVAVYKPIFFEGNLVAWSAAKGHQADIGGAVAGGYNPNAVEVWQEALRIPPVKVYDRGKFSEPVDLIGARNLAWRTDRNNRISLKHGTGRPLCSGLDVVDPHPPEYGRGHGRRDRHATEAKQVALRS